MPPQNFSGHFSVPPYDLEKQLCSPGWLRDVEKNAILKAESIHKSKDNKGRPSLIAALLSHKIYYMYHRGWMNAAVLKKCDKCINDFIGAWMACEKIVGVPMVFPYTQMLSIFMVLFVYTFPFPLAHIFFNEDAEFNGFFITPFICACESQCRSQLGADRTQQSVGLPAVRRPAFLTSALVCLPLQWWPSRSSA